MLKVSDFLGKGAKGAKGAKRAEVSFPKKG